MFDLAPVGRYRLSRPPLVHALGQIRYPLRARLQTLDGVAPLQDRLLDLFPYMDQEQIQQVSLLVGPGMTPAGEAQTARTWRFTDDVGWTLIVAADAATLSIGPQYGDFEDFRSRFATVVGALHEAAGLPRCDRLGLRYVDIAEMPPGNHGAWREWFRPELVGWSGGSIVAEGTNVVTSIPRPRSRRRLSGISPDHRSTSRQLCVMATSPPTPWSRASFPSRSPAPRSLSMSISS